MSNKISIYLNSSELKIEALQEMLKSKFSENADLDFSLKTEEDASARGLSEDLIHYIQIALPIVKDLGLEVAEKVVDSVIDKFIEHLTARIIDAVKTYFKERGTAKKTIITVETKKGKTIKRTADEEIPIKLNPEDEIEVIHVEEQ